MSLCAQSWEQALCQLLHLLHATSKIFSVGTVKNSGLIKKIKVDKSTRKKKIKQQTSCLNYFFKGNAKSQKTTKHMQF